MTSAGHPGRFADEAAALDSADPLGWALGRYVPLAADVVAYLDGNSLGRPLRATAAALADFVAGAWGSRLIRSWGEGWLELPAALGDRLGATALGAGPGQVVLADSTSVLIYKLARAAVAARPGRTRIVTDTDNFPTDRWLLEGIAGECGLALGWIDVDPAGGVGADQVAGAIGEDTALVVLSHVAYRSAWIADGAAITAACHDVGALVLWDCSHSVASVPVELDRWGADLAVGCGYKYLGGGPGAPAFAYVASELQPELHQPIWGWLGHADPFAMGPTFEPAAGIASVLSGTPPILGLVPLAVSLDLIGDAGIDAIRRKSVLLTDLAVRMADDAGVVVASPRDPAQRGGHVTLTGSGFDAVNEALWARGVIPDFRRPDAIRVGLAPLSTSFAELVAGMSAVADEVRRSR